MLEDVCSGALRSIVKPQGLGLQPLKLFDKLFAGVFAFRKLAASRDRLDQCGYRINILDATPNRIPCHLKLEAVSQRPRRIGGGRRYQGELIAGLFQKLS